MKEHPLQGFTGKGRHSWVSAAGYCITLSFPFGPAGISKLNVLSVPCPTFHQRIPEHCKSKPMNSGTASLW